MRMFRNVWVSLGVLFLVNLVFPAALFAADAATGQTAAAEESSGMGTGAKLQAGHAPLGGTVKMYLAISAGLCIAIAAFGGALAQSRAVAAAVTGISRNPGASGKIFVPMIVGLALIESLVLYAWIVALQLSGKI